MNKIKKGIAGLLTLATLYSTTPKCNGRIELSVGNRGAGIDSEFSVNLGKRSSIYNRNIANMDYEKTLSIFSLVDVLGTIYKGLSGLVELKGGSGQQINPRVGLAYFGKKEKNNNEFSMYVAPTVKVSKETDGDVFLGLSHKKKFNSKFAIETASGNLFIYPKSLYYNSLNRTGVNIKGFGIGGRYSLTVQKERGEKPEVNHEFGGYLSRSF